MKAKKLLYSLALVAALCAMLIVAVCAQDTDAKIIRFDGMGNVDATLHMAGIGTASIAGNGSLHISIPKDKAVGNNVQPEFKKIADEDAFNINDYPYIKMKYRTNYLAAAQFYIADVLNTQHTVCEMSNVVKSADQWYTVKIKVPIDTPYNGVVTYNDGDHSWPLEAVGAVPEKRQWLSDSFVLKAAPFFQFKYIKEDQVAALGDEELYVEIEYIAYFKTEEAMNEYAEEEAHYHIITFDNSSETVANVVEHDDTSRACGSHTVENGTVTMDTFTATGDSITYRLNANLKNAGKFNLADYPYVKVKMTTDWPAAIQFYLQDTDDSDHFYYANLETNTSYKTGTTITPMFHLVASKYNAPDGTSWYMEKQKNFPPYEYTPKDGEPTTSQAPLRSAFFMIRGSKGAVPNQHYTTVVDYVGFFDSEEAMMAYDSPKDYDKLTADVDSVVESVIGDLDSYSYVMLPGSSSSDIADYVQQQVESAAGGDVVITAVADESYKEGDKTCKVIFTIVGEYISRELGFTVTILPDFKLEIMGAQIRVDDGDAQALRFGTKIYDYDDAPYDSVSFGTLIIPAEVLKEGELTHETADVADVEGVNIFEKGDGYQVYTAVLTDIPPEKYDTEITARPYVKYVVDGEPYYVYGDTITRTVNGVKAAVAGQGDDYWNNN